jgi:hypothetical protein
MRCTKAVASAMLNADRMSASIIAGSESAVRCACPYDICAGVSADLSWSFRYKAVTRSTCNSREPRNHCNVSQPDSSTWQAFAR